MSALEAVMNSDVPIPPEITTPLELAKWALQRAADKLKQEELNRTVSLVTPHSHGKRSVLFAWEHPRDPNEYADHSQAPATGYVSVFAFPEWKLYAELYGVHLARFDQGSLGHRRPKPSSIGTTSWYLCEQLDQRFLTREQRVAFGRGPVSKKSRLEEVPSWAVWAPGLTALVREAWPRWLAEHGTQPEAEARRVMLARLTEEQKWQLRQANDHIPYMRGCPTCVTSQARQRSHWRSTCTTVHSASFDLAGPFVPGRAFDPIASGRDRGWGYKYFLACAFSVPSAAPLDSDVAMPAPEEEPFESECLEPVEAADVLSSRDRGPEDGVSDDGAGVAFHLDKVTTRVRGKRPEDPDPLETANEELPLPPPPEPPRTCTLCFWELL